MPDASVALVLAPPPVVDAGAEVQLVQVDPDDPDPTVRQTPDSDEGPVKPPRTVDRQRPAPLGYLYVDAVPWAKVSVSGKTIGETPIAKFPVERGFVNVVLHNPDTGKTVRKKVKVLAGKVAYVKEDLR
jgi:hypothetical protein